CALPIFKFRAYVATPVPFSRLRLKPSIITNGRVPSAKTLGLCSLSTEVATPSVSVGRRSVLIAPMPEASRRWPSAPLTGRTRGVKERRERAPRDDTRQAPKPRRSRVLPFPNRYAAPDAGYTCSSASEHLPRKTPTHVDRCYRHRGERFVADRS